MPRTARVIANIVGLGLARRHNPNIGIISNTANKNTLTVHVQRDDLGPPWKDECMFLKRLSLAIEDLSHSTSTEIRPEKIF